MSRVPDEFFCFAGIFGQLQVSVSCRIEPFRSLDCELNEVLQTAFVVLIITLSIRRRIWHCKHEDYNTHTVNIILAIFCVDVILWNDFVWLSLGIHCRLL